jgi:demethoxyubiquinone hydroxylase (CLK1/Coq7/Cat5 family)
MTVMANTNDVDTLNSFLRGELSAVETYRQASKHLKSDIAKTEVKECLEDHEARVVALRERIQNLGGNPSEGSGVWGAFAKTVQGAADVLGEKAAIAALEEGEDHGIADYDRDVKKLHGEARTFALQQLVPAQKRTHKKLSNLKHNPNLH